MLRGLLGGLFWGAIVSGVILCLFLIMSDVRLLSQPTVAQAPESASATVAINQEPAEGLAQLPAAEAASDAEPTVAAPSVATPAAPESSGLPSEVTESAIRPEALESEAELSAPSADPSGAQIALSATQDDAISGSDGPIPSVPSADAPLDVQQSADTPRPVEAATAEPELITPQGQNAELPQVQDGDAAGVGTASVQAGAAPSSEDVPPSRVAPVGALDPQQPADAPKPFEDPVVDPELTVPDTKSAMQGGEAEAGGDIPDAPAFGTATAENLTPEAEAGEQDIVTAPTEPLAPVVSQRVLPQITPPVAEAEVAPAFEEAPASEQSAKFQTPPNRIATEASEDSLPTVTTDRLPRIGVTVPSESPELNAPLEVVDISTLPALEAYGVPFLGDESLPKYAVVLIDDGSGAIDPMAFTDFPIPLAFAIDAARADAASAAYDYRRAGFEVVLLTRLPTGATPGDIEVAFEAYHTVLPEAVAILDTGESGFQEDRNLIRQVASVAKERGQGILAFAQGLNAVKQVADREEVPSATVFRNFDGEGQSVTTMKRYLNRAAFKAAQEGHVVMVGHTRADTIKALVEWVLDDKSNSVALAPVSAILLDQ